MSGVKRGQAGSGQGRQGTRDGGIYSGQGNICKRMASGRTWREKRREMEAEVQRAEGVGSGAAQAFAFH